MSAPSLERVAERFDSSAEARIRSLFRTCPADQFLAELSRYVPATRDEEATFEKFRGWALYDSGENQIARIHLMRALRRSRPGTRDRALIRGLLADVCLRLGRFDLAERCTHRALANLPEEDEGAFLRVGHLLHLGRAYRRRGHITHALATYRRALSLIGPESPWWHPITSSLSFALMVHGDVHEADALIREHRRLAGSEHVGREWMTIMMEIFSSVFLHDLDRADRLVDEFAAVADVEGERTRLMWIEAACAAARARGDWARSEQMLRGAIERSQLAGRHSDFVASLARALAESLEGLGRFEEALEPARLAIRAGSHEDRLEWCLGLHVLGRCLARLDRRDEARRTFQEAVGLHERFQYHLAHARLQETLVELRISGLAAGVTNGAHPARRKTSAAEPILVRLRDGRPFLTCDRPLLEAIELAAASALPALIEGETGTGKELVARLLHELNESRSGPFVVVDCSTLPAELADAELFGAVRGAYTGAHRDRAGLVADADGGTLLLDELPELTLPLQAKLLRTLQDGTYRRVGENAVRRARVRIVAATNRAVDELIRMGQLKTDLFYRLNGHRIRLEPLRHRRDEIQPLAEQTAISCGLAGFTSAALRQLREYDWPGNVRQLEMAVRVAACRCAPGQRIDAAHLDLNAGGTTHAPAGDSLRSARAAWERTALIRALRENDDVIARAARSLGLTRQAFYKAMRRTGLSTREVRASKLSPSPRTE